MARAPGRVDGDRVAGLPGPRPQQVPQAGADGLPALFGLFDGRGEGVGLAQPVDPFARLLVDADGTDGPVALSVAPAAAGTAASAVSRRARKAAPVAALRRARVRGKRA